MTTAEFKEAVEIAASSIELNHCLSIFDGFGLPGFRPITVTLFQVARLIRWQALQINGEWDNEALNDVRNFGRCRFVIVP